MGIQSAIAGIQDVVKAISGIRSAPDYAPDIASVLPMAITYPENGEYNHFTGGSYTALHNIVIEVHYPRTDLVKAIKSSIDMIDAIPAALIADPTCNGSIQTFKNITYTYGSMTWGEGANNLTTFGVRFTLNNVKLQT